MNDPLPIQALRGDFLREVARGPVSLTAPTGSGKSTQAPRWLMAGGPVLVVEPRRVACRALASRVAELEGCRLGDRVGYLVRGEARARPDTRLLFATPGVVLRMMEQGRLSRFATLVLDEFHERSLEVDDSGPSLMLTTPERGDTLLKDTQDDSVPVQGTVSDDMGEVASLSMSINGEATQAVAVRVSSGRSPGGGPLARVSSTEEPSRTRASGSAAGTVCRCSPGAKNSP